MFKTRKKFTQFLLGNYFRRRLEKLEGTYFDVRVGIEVTFCLLALFVDFLSSSALDEGICFGSKDQGHEHYEHSYSSEHEVLFVLVSVLFRCWFKTGPVNDSV